ncbi:hypothetical protein [Paracoccus sp. (in: a-proteobacteria)]|uniref:hypothetical protein n=1 Tax=Paracoccus sp. TaxID=267 RepID=UPI0028A2131B|nr:hypothetical protein [Paracoccus sp. (in: a-proteobacteria)]
MELTTGAILRRITHTNLSCAAHKLATLILDGIAWKQGYNGLPHGTAAFTLSDLAERMEVSRQHLHNLLTELAASGLRLLRHRGKGRSAPWLFRFGCCDQPDAEDDVSTTADISPYIRDSNKNVFHGTIMVDREKPETAARWLALIGKAKAALPCRAADSRHIWDRFREFNRRRGREVVPAGYLLGFMRKWKGSGAEFRQGPPPQAAASVSPEAAQLQRLMAPAPFINRYFHESDLKRTIGVDRYEERVDDLRSRFGCSVFQAQLAVHGMAVAKGVIQR